MARKSKRMELNEAIRQGQAKIAEGLKTGQMRSDNSPAQANPNDKELGFDGIAPGRAGYLKSKEKSTFGGTLPPKAKLILLACIALLVLGIWLVAALVKTEPTETPVLPGDPITTGSGTEIDAREKTKPVQKREAPPEKTTPTDGKNEVVEPVPVVSSGDNVILIQSIQIDRKSELVPLRDFFNRKGVSTEIIEIPADRLAALVTKAGFTNNPAAAGTDGYALLQRIKQLGPVYVGETEDTKFGVKPFQDAYGYNKRK